MVFGTLPVSKPSARASSRRQGTQARLVQVILSHGGPVVAAVVSGLHALSPVVACEACACTLQLAKVAGPGLQPVAQPLLQGVLPLLRARQQSVCPFGAATPAPPLGCVRTCMVASVFVGQQTAASLGPAWELAHA